MNRSLPFPLSKQQQFFDQLGDYIGDVFYEMLPEKGYELRDEQIFMAFQLEQAFKKRSVMFAEAGVGTGKTFVYLLYAICYARYTGKPAIISCADETLIEQLVKEEGDIRKLEQALGFEVDVRLAKAREQYVCMRKLDPLVQQFGDDEDVTQVHEEIPSFVFNDSPSMQQFRRYGDRKDYPWVSNEKWERMAWDPLQPCTTCEWRHRCGQTLHRDYYRKATDLIICSHDFYMEHVWTKESRKREGQLPLLPEASCVVFDEGHLLEFAAQKALTYRFHLATLQNVLTSFMDQDVREKTLYVIEDVLALHDEWFHILQTTAVPVEGSNRKEVPFGPEMLEQAKALYGKVQQLLEELVFDSEMYVVEEYHMKMIEEHLEFLSYGLSILLKEGDGIFWLEETEGETTFVIMPRLVEDVLRQEVFSLNIPFIFSSATLSQRGDFSYLASALGIEDPLTFSVDSPFDYERQMQVKGHITDEEMKKWEVIGQALRENGGSSLILFTSQEEMNRFRRWAESSEWSFSILYEGDREISELVKQFQKETDTVLCSYHLWEGLDVPGEALTQVVIASLPFPPKDPVFEAKRKHASDPEVEVDLPYMLLRLRQGIGRLIRSHHDHGKVHLWMSTNEKQAYSESVAEVVPIPIDWKE
ncbi:ATP-dependent DNA helicase [Halalkalibacterium halodurans]|uniref:ATP-dependent DNA helicase n=1 Tax=Halalkalibacterium halodurans TaxID=86665 RepID=UPI002E2077F1|nr:ATP-dependent DNA helicase [Halalkalibacterium halodurans]